MIKNNFPYLILIFINIAIAISCYFYPVSRDEFYYLEKVNYPNVFEEYYNSYHFGNPRIGQFFSNLISRNILLEIVFGVLLFNAFIGVLFLNIYRRIPNFKQANEVWKFLCLTATFIFVINYFGEMFYYTPYSGNYTFTHVFYLIYVFIIGEYYLYGNKDLIKKFPVLVLIIAGIFIGMANEHVPPVLVGISFLCAAIYYLKFKKTPNYKLIILPTAVLVGYALLFFAPANKIKQEVVGKSVLDTSFSDYLQNWSEILKVYYYYNQELIFFVFAVVFIAIFFWKRKTTPIKLQKKKIAFWGLLFILPLMIVAVSPLIGPRLLFFSTSILFIILYKIILMFFKLNEDKIFRTISVLFLVVFFGMSSIMTFRANQNYEALISEIKQKRKQTKDIVLDHQLNYFTLEIGSYFNFNRKIFIESGEDYLDKDASKNTSTENNLINYFNLKTIKEK